jgi:glycosyltransferase involved in cell wall biosynthesis
MATLGRFTSAFTETGQNMNLGANAARERREYLQQAPPWARRAAPLVDVHFRLRRLLAGHYHCTPHQYAIYTDEDPDRRRCFEVRAPTFRWVRPTPHPPAASPVRFTIVTPSFRSARWLRLCIASVADQAVSLEHIVQDAGSDDGTLDWLPGEPRVMAIVEKDQGMYDAVNRGWRRARGEFLAYLNCDEQYLPGALRAVSEFFDRRPEVDVVFGDAVVVNEAGRYVCDRRPVTPRVAHSLVSGNLSFLTAATFIRRCFVERHQLYFQPEWRVAGDCEWAVRLVRAGARMACLRQRLSTFTDTGQNLAGGGARHRQEIETLFGKAPRWMQLAAPLVVAHYRLRRLVQGAYWGRRHAYAIYTLESPAERRVFHADHPTFRWKRLPAA